MNYTFAIIIIVIIVTIISTILLFPVTSADVTVSGSINALNPTSSTCASTNSNTVCFSTLASTDGKHRFAAQSDGNVVLYNGTNVIWSSKTNGRGSAPFKLIMQNDGNLVMYDSTNASTWSSNTRGVGVAPYNLIMQTDGNAVIYDATKRVTWSSNTSGM